MILGFRLFDLHIKVLKLLWQSVYDVKYVEYVTMAVLTAFVCIMNNSHRDMLN